MRKCLAESSCTGQQSSGCLLPFCSRTTAQDLAAARGDGGVGEQRGSTSDTKGYGGRGSLGEQWEGNGATNGSGG